MTTLLNLAALGLVMTWFVVGVTIEERGPYVIAVLLLAIYTRLSEVLRELRRPRQEKDSVARAIREAAMRA